ncbi:MAG: response regulator transcription factor [Hamadaea sp.]|uniref:response regulator transcription factor n=1 Tax=Hamadaea sp. TaxID=2024425 RepID=UPI00185938AB|nr:response regulator transcription factor [Hamadaea sp.]NUR71027.1 response regulator transcription factor [Hamadaea sp.]NUT23708.1 response regulator transcription factor [Hamadaea sp.]
MIRLLVADDEPMIRSGVRAILASDPGIELVAEAGDGREAVELALRHRPDVALLDIRMPKLDGLAAAREIRRGLPETAVLMLTTFGEDEYISAALAAGASGFLLKSGDPRELPAGVRAAAEGAAFLSPRVARRVIAHLGGDQLTRVADARARVGRLSEREREVLALIGAGLSNQEISERLFLGAGTVKTHVSSILTRLDLRNRVQAAILAYEAGLSGAADTESPPPPR